MCVLPFLLFYNFHLHVVFSSIPSLLVNVSLDLKWIFCWQHIYGSCFWMHSASLFLLVGVFNPFTFNVVVNKYVLIVIYLNWGHVLAVLSLFSSLPLFVLFSWYLLTVFSTMFGLVFLFYVCDHCSYLTSSSPYSLIYPPICVHNCFCLLVS